MSAAYIVALRQPFRNRLAHLMQVLYYTLRHFVSFSLVSAPPTSLPFLLVFSFSQTHALSSLWLFFFFLLSYSLARLARTILSILFYCKMAMGPRSLISFG